MRALLRRLLALLMPEGALLLGAILFARHLATTETGALVVDVLPWAVFISGAALGARFGRTRLLFALAVVGLALAGVRFAGTMSAEDPAGAAVAVHLIALLLPANLVALAFAGERGLLTRSGLVRAGSIVGQAALVVLTSRTAQTDALTVLSLTPLPESWVRASSTGQIAAIAVVVSAGILLVRVLLSREPFARSLLWALAACFLGLQVHADAATSTIYLAAAGLALVVGTVEGAHAMAFRDELTGLPSRRALFELLARLDEPYTLAMVDVDHFKQFNDRHGHEVGDQVLRMVAARLNEVRGSGRAFRFGGEEFTIVFPGTPMDDALPHLDAVRRAIEDSAFVLRQPGRPRQPPRKVTGRRVGAGNGGARQRLRVTVSVGAAQRSSRLQNDEQVIRAADQALYRAKGAGRNRVAT